ncbi:MAG: RNA polymerase sigma factor [Proteobacteria bacterium]|nr:RNA polymerase sigma factor [Pseudomonadota bacterium]
MQTLRLLQENSIIEDDEIKEIAQTNRGQGIDLIVRKYRMRIFHHACYVVKDYEIAMDVAQEVFIKAMREKRFFNDEFKMKAWLFRVTSNLCFNIVRNRKRRGTILASMDSKKVTDASQLDVVFSSQRQKVVLAAMEQLTRNHKEILMLRYYSDLSYAEIAETLGIRLGTVMSRLSRAKNHLLRVMDDTPVLEA